MTDEKLMQVYDELVEDPADSAYVAAADQGLSDALSDLKASLTECRRIAWGVTGKEELGWRGSIISAADLMRLHLADMEEYAGKLEKYALAYGAAVGRKAFVMGYHAAEYSQTGIADNEHTEDLAKRPGASI